jgi:hypothetical protein
MEKQTSDPAGNPDTLRLRAKTPIFKMKCHPDRSEAQWRDLLFTSAASNLNGSATLPFVIPTEA